MKSVYAVLLDSATVCGEEFALTSPGDSDQAVHAKFHDGKVRAKVFERNAVWLEKG